MAKVIDFKTAKDKRDPIAANTNEELYSDPDLNVEFAIDFAIDATHNIVSSLYGEGLIAYDVDCAYDLVLVTEAIKGLALRSMKQDFPTQDLARSVFEIDDIEDFLTQFFEKT